MLSLMKKIGMIGLGAMGHSVAENVLKAGFPMVLFDIRPEAYQDLLGENATGAAAICRTAEACVLPPVQAGIVPKSR